jgi:hypothetical protein
LAAIRGVGYSGQPQIDPKLLPGYGATLRFCKNLNENGEMCVTWELPDGTVVTSQSPAVSHGSFSGRQDWTDVLRQVYEVLQLPGSTADYHFALLRAYELLWARRRQSPEVLPHIEYLCLLDIALVENRPEAIRHTNGTEVVTARVPAFAYLTRLYEREGFLDEALAIARRAAALDQGDSDVVRLVEKVRELRSEDG